VPSEIERKFLVSTLPARLQQRPGTHVEQGYLAISEQAEVRVRRAGEALTLTVKVGHGESREEVEVALGREQFERLWPLTEGARVAKTRRRIPLPDGLRAEVDSYNGRLGGLQVAEVEFPTAERSHQFEPPGWLGEELTGDQRYSNQSLATAGLPERSPFRGAERTVSAAYRLKSKESPAAEMRRIALGRAQRARERLRGASGEGAAEAIHGARKDLKKVRAVLRLVRDGLGEETYRAENRRFRDAGRLLSESRDAEVKLETLGKLRERFGETLAPSQARAWTAALEADRARVRSAGAEARTRRAIEAIAAGAERVGEWELEPDSWKLLEPGLDRCYRRGRVALAAVRADREDDQSVHELRKRVKDLWYQQRLLAETWPHLLEPSAEEAHRLADLLGDHHDLAVLAADLRARGALPADRGPTEALIAERQSELLSEALALGGRLYTEKPKWFRRRMRGYWRAWRDTFDQ
jgi:CYTH domain-containing protein/CHAD domain-containing protein